MPAIAREEYLRRLVDHAEEVGLKAQFDFRQYTIYTKRGEVVAWFDMDDRQNFRLSGRLFKTMSSRLTSQDIGARRLILRYNIPNPKIVPIFDGRYVGVGAYADDLSKGANVPDEVGSDGILKPGFVYDPVTDSRRRQR